jgi:nitrogen fixation NifU-like protein
MKVRYNEVVLDHFNNPRNVGELKNANAIGTVGSKTCGDIMTVYLRIEKNIIKNIKFKTYGCAAAIASGSIATELAKGMKIKDALELTREDISNELGGLPEFKLHCSNLAADAIHKAIKNYKKLNK